jgi:hypothetical protein
MLPDENLLSKQHNISLLNPSLIAPPAKKAIPNQIALNRLQILIIKQKTPNNNRPTIQSILIIKSPPSTISLIKRSININDYPIKKRSSHQKLIILIQN